MTSLETADLAVGYESRAAISGVSLAFERGRVTALVGPNGAGKTTLLRALARLLPILSGEMRLDGRSSASFGSRAWASRVAYAPASDEAVWPLTVEDAVALGRAPHRGWLAPFDGDDRAATEKALVRMDLIALRRRTLPTLSSGERHRVALARALAQEPLVLLLDEPTAFLDLRHQGDLASILRGLARRDGLSVVVSLHDLTLAAQIADRVTLLSGGRVVADGAPPKVFTPRILETAYGTKLSVTRLPGRGTAVVTPLWQDAP